MVLSCRMKSSWSILWLGAEKSFQPLTESRRAVEVAGDGEVAVAETSGSEDRDRTAVPTSQKLVNRAGRKNVPASAVRSAG